MTISIRCCYCHREWDRVPEGKLQEALSEAALFGWQVSPPITCSHCLEEPVVEPLPVTEPVQ